MVEKDIRQRRTFKKWFKYQFGTTWQSQLFNFLNYALFIVLAIVVVYPFFYVLKTSFESHDITTGVLRVTYSFEAYKKIFENDGLIKSFLLTILVLVIYIPIHLFMTMSAGYALTHKNLKGRNLFIFLIVFTMIFSGGLIPYYILIRDLGLRGNFMVYIVVGLVSPYNIIIAKNFIGNIPTEIFESAKIDGANDFSILMRIVMPISKPIMATIGLWAGVAKWNDWMTGVLYMQNKKDLWLIQNFLRNILIATQSTGTGGIVDPDLMAMAESVKMASIVISIIPIILIYPFIQKHFVKGILTGSVKG